MYKLPVNGNYKWESASPYPTVEEHANKNFDWHYLHYYDKGEKVSMYSTCVHEMLSFVMDYFSIPFHKYPDFFFIFRTVRDIYKILRYLKNSGIFRDIYNIFLAELCVFLVIFLKQYSVTSVSIFQKQSSSLVSS